MQSDKVIQLVMAYGSPLYVFDEMAFSKNLTNLCNEFRNIYPNYNLAYSYKTNYTPHICKLVKQLGGWAEVVSDMELQVALNIGYTHDKIIYNGPCKGSMLEKHLLNDGILNIDNQAEAERIIRLSNDHPDKLFKVWIRINTDIGANFISRFGFDCNGSEIEQVIDLLKVQKNICIVGLHMHVSRARGLVAWKNRINQILDVADRIIDGIPDYIDVGSGMFADMESSLKSQFTIDVPTYKEYANIVAGAMASHYKRVDKKPILFSEPGTTVVSRYLSLITTVTSFKKVRERNIAILDSDIHNAGETCQMMKLPFSHITSGTGGHSGAPIDLTGFTCLEQDVIYKDFPNPVHIGDVIEFRNVGGYSVVYKPPFINPCCAMLALKEDGSTELIKRKETFEDVFQTYKF